MYSWIQRPAKCHRVALTGQDPDVRGHLSNETRMSWERGQGGKRKNGEGQAACKFVNSWLLIIYNSATRLRIASATRHLTVRFCFCYFLSRQVFSRYRRMHSTLARSDWLVLTRTVWQPTLNDSPTKSVDSSWTSLNRIDFTDLRSLPRFLSSFVQVLGGIASSCSAKKCNTSKLGWSYWNVMSDYHFYTVSQKNLTPATFCNNSNSPGSIAIDFDKNNR